MRTPRLRRVRRHPAVPDRCPLGRYRLRRGTARLAVVCLAAWLGPAPVAAQGLPGGPVTLGDGRVVISGDVAVSGAPDDLGFFNYSDYEHSALREVRVGVAAEVKASRRLSFLGEVRTGQLAVRPFSLFARLQPWPGRRISVQAGRIPPTFGSYTRRAYSRDNPLIGYPMAYQYLTSLRTDSVPTSTDDLIRMRGRGWLTAFSEGATHLDRGVPLVTIFSRDTGVQVTASWRALETSASVTLGSPASPVLNDGNGGVTVAARAALTPAPGFVLGASFAEGAFLRDSVGTLGTRKGRGGQRVGGIDLEVAGGRWVTRADVVVSEWRMPVIGGPPLADPLRAVAFALEVRRNVIPGFYLAGRAERLTFSTVRTSSGPVSWDAAVTRVEAGVGFSLLHNLVARTTIQLNRRDGGRVTDNLLPAAQLLFWF
ncbi:MAG: hypothetical protein AB7I25_02690 [Vicinamibacterales bacterium]